MTPLRQRMLEDLQVRNLSSPAQLGPEEVRAYLVTGGAARALHYAACMPLAAGQRLGPYEIVATLGAGGMSACGCVSERSESSALAWGWAAFARPSRASASYAEASRRRGPTPFLKEDPPSPCR